MSTRLYFATSCFHCSQKNLVCVNQLGSQVCCDKCRALFVAKDTDLESAAMDERVSELAQTMEWSAECAIKSNRPR